MSTEVANLSNVDNEISVPALKLAGLLRKLLLKMFDQTPLRC